MIVRSLYTCVAVVTLLLLSGATASSQITNGYFDGFQLAAPCYLDGNGIFLPPYRIVNGWRSGTQGGTPDLFVGGCPDPAPNGIVYGVPVNSFCGAGFLEGQPDGRFPNAIQPEAYIGFASSTMRRIVQGVPENLEFREYATNILNAPLVPNGTYRLRFLIAAAEGGEDSYFNEYNVNQFALKRIGVLLSTLLPNQNTQGPMNVLNNNNNQLINVEAPQFWYNGQYPRWVQVVTQPFTINGNQKNYVTIGNFEATLDAANTALIADHGQPNYPDQTNIENYYFLDNVQLENANTFCTCENIEFTVARSAVEQPGYCCYDIRIKNSAVCEITKMNFEVQFTQFSEDFDLSQDPIETGETRVIQVCVPEFGSAYENANRPNSEGVMSLIRFYTGTQQLICETESWLRCKCDCGNLDANEPSKDGVSIVFERVQSTDPNKCCWDVFLVNDRECDFDDITGWYVSMEGIDLDNISFLADATYSDGVNNIFDAQGNFIGQRQNYANMTLARKSRLRIAQVCIDAGTPPVDLEMKLTFDTRPEGAYWDYCESIFRQRLECELDPPDCCPHMQVWMRYPRTNEFIPIDCSCVFIEASMIQSPGCQVYSVTVERTGTQGFAEKTTIGGNGVPVLIPSLPASRRVAIVCGGLDCPCTYVVKFRDANGLVICEHTFNRPLCSPAGPFGKEQIIPSKPIKSNVKEESSYYIVDVRGRIIQSARGIDNEEQVVSEFMNGTEPHGMYLLRIVDPSGVVVVRKLMK